MNFIKNLSELTKNSHKIRKDVLSILEYALGEAMPESAIKEEVKLEEDLLKVSDKEFSLSRIENIFVIGGGKATYIMARVLYDIIGEKITEGAITTNESSKEDIGPIEVIAAGHPIPTEEGVKGTKRILSIAEKAKEDDLIIVLVSGGGSALLAAPSFGISLSDLQTTNELLLASGASIKEINTIRKHISRIKGGRLSQVAYPARLTALIVSDVVGDDLSVISSGPTVGDGTSYEDAYNVLKRYNLTERIPSSVLSVVKNGMDGQIPETPYPGDRVLSKTFNRIILSSSAALESARRKAEELGYNTFILSSAIEGKAEEVGASHARIAEEVFSSGVPVKTPAVILSGGESVVTLDAIGKEEGGPNQECVMGFAYKMNFLNKAAFLSVDSDGIDGYSGFAGGIIGGNNKEIDGDKIKEALKKHSSSNFLREIGGGIETGKTGTNVNDIRILGVVK
ncbi:MAG: glycerate kinase [candidate division WOR-3 bacterium]